MQSPNDPNGAGYPPSAPQGMMPPNMGVDPTQQVYPQTMPMDPYQQQMMQQGFSGAYPPVQPVPLDPFAQQQMMQQGFSGTYPPVEQPMWQMGYPQPMQGVDPYGQPIQGVDPYQQQMQAMDPYGQAMQGVDPYGQPMPNIPPPTKPKKKKKPKKPKRPPSRYRWLKILILLLILGGVGWYVWDTYFVVREATAIIQTGSVGHTYSGDALIVRNETTYSDEGVQSIEYVAQEGSTVARGDVICYVYSTGYSTSEMTTLQEIRDQIRDYQISLLSNEAAFDQNMDRLESEVIDKALEVRNMVQGTRGNFLSLEETLDDAISARQTYFASKYSSDMSLSRLYDDETTQERRIESWIKQEMAMQESIVSFYTDGFEYALSPSLYEQYTPAEVRSMISGNVPSTGIVARSQTDLYRLVQDNNYAVLMLVYDDNWNPIEGQVYTLVLEQFSDTVVNAQVTSFTRSGGELLVRLAVMGEVSDVLYMRTCQATIGEYADTLVVPKSALYEQSGSTGVVLVDGDQQLFVPIYVHDQQGDSAYISSIQLGVLSQGQTVRLFY